MTTIYLLCEGVDAICAYECREDAERALRDMRDSAYIEEITLYKRKK